MADQGIGLQIAIDLLESGCDVIAHYFASDAKLGHLLELAEKVNRRARAWIMQADLTKEKEVKTLKEKP